MDDAQRIAETEGYFWGDAVRESYFELAEQVMEQQWRSHVWPVLRAHSIDYSHVLDLAAGHGRNTARLLEFAQKVTIVDINEDNVAFCKKRFAGDNRVSFIKNNGLLIPEVPNDSVTLFYTFDAMVHFDLEIVQSYIKEAFRVIKPNGTGFFHYSNYSASPGADFRANPHWRNFMSKSLFEHVALRAGFTIVSSMTAPWGDFLDLDGITLVQKSDGKA